MSDERAQILGKIFDALYLAEFGLPQFKAENELLVECLLEQASRASGKSVAIIREAILKKRYPDYRKNRLKAEMPSVPPKAREQ
jgi:hypothetical protein